MGLLLEVARSCTILLGPDLANSRGSERLPGVVGFGDCLSVTKRTPASVS